VRYLSRTGKLYMYWLFDTHAHYTRSRTGNSYSGIPILLRVYFKYDRELLTEFCHYYRYLLFKFLIFRNAPRCESRQRIKTAITMRTKRSAINIFLPIYFARLFYVPIFLKLLENPQKTRTKYNSINGK